MTSAVAKISSSTFVRRILISLFGAALLGALAIAYNVGKTERFGTDAWPIFLRTMSVALFCFVVAVPVARRLVLVNIKSPIAQAAVWGALVGLIIGWTGTVAMLGRWVPEANITIAFVAVSIFINVRAAKREMKSGDTVVAN